MSRHQKREKGTVIVETALMLPLFLLILMGSMEFGSVLHSYLKLQNAAREGARHGAIGVTEASIIDRVRSFSTNLDQSTLDITVTNAEGGRGEALTVACTYSQPIITPLIGTIVGGQTIQLASEVTMRLE